MPAAPASPVPVALFAYARPEVLKRTIEGLRRALVPRLYVFCDGPRSEAEFAGVEAVRQMVRRIDWCDVQRVERESNLGLGRSIRAGVSSVLKENEAVIVMEDDLLCAPPLYNFLSAALHAYRDEPRVMSVTGWTHPRVRPPDAAGRPYFDGRAECWSWGTWRRAWAGMEDRTAPELIDACRQAGIDPASYGGDLLDQAAQEKARNLWAARWCFHHLLQRGLCVRPPCTLVNHTGAGSGATNLTGADPWDQPLREAEAFVTPASWPEPREHPSCGPLWRRATRPGILRSLRRALGPLLRRKR